MKAATAKTAFLFYLCCTFRVTWGQTTAMCNSNYDCAPSTGFQALECGPDPAATALSTITIGDNDPDPLATCQSACTADPNCIAFTLATAVVTIPMVAVFTSFPCTLYGVGALPFPTAYPNDDPPVITTRNAYGRCMCSFQFENIDVFSGCNIMKLALAEPCGTAGTSSLIATLTGLSLDQCRDQCFANFDCQTYTWDSTTNECKTYNSVLNSNCQVTTSTNADLYFIGNCDPKEAPGCGYKTKTNTGGDYGSYATKTNTAQTYKACWEWCRSEGRCRAHYWTEDTPGGSTGTCALHTAVTAATTSPATGVYCAEYMCDCGMDPACYPLE